MSHAQNIQEFMEIAKILEIPVHVPHIGINLFKPDRIPITQEDIIKFDNEDHKSLYSVKRPSHSLTRNFYNHMVAGMCSMNATDQSVFGDEHINYKITAGNIRGNTSLGLGPTAANYLQELNYGGGYGIRIGIDNTAESFEDYRMISAVIHGDSSGEMRYFGHIAVVRTWSGGDRQWTSVYTRYFCNHSGGSITIAEVGIYAWCRYGSVQATVMMIRDVLDSPVAVDDGELIKVDYEFKSTVWPS